MLINTILHLNVHRVIEATLVTLGHIVHIFDAQHKGYLFYSILTLYTTITSIITIYNLLTRSNSTITISYRLILPTQNNSMEKLETKITEPAYKRTVFYCSRCRTAISIDSKEEEKEVQEKHDKCGNIGAGTFR